MLWNFWTLFLAAAYNLGFALNSDINGNSQYFSSQYLKSHNPIMRGDYRAEIHIAEREGDYIPDRMFRGLGQGGERHLVTLSLGACCSPVPAPLISK